MSSRHGKKGFVLALSAVLLLSISIIVAAFIFLVTIRTRAAASGLDSAKAFWLAEAGVQQVIYKVMSDSAYRNAPTTVTGSLGSGTYSVSVVKLAGTAYTMTSTGTAGIVSRNVVQTATFSFAGWSAPFANYGVFAKAGNVILQNSANTITGDVYAAVGTVTTMGFSTVTGTVYADKGSGNYKRLPLPIPNIPGPELDKTDYTTLINKAGTYIKKDMTYSTLNLAGGIVYVNGRVTATNITGPGTVVCTGNFIVNGGTVGKDVSIISNATLSMANYSHVQPGAVIYASTSISLTGSSVVLDNATLITPGTAVLNANSLTVNGVILCEGNLALQKGTIVNGSVVSGGTITMSSSAQIVQDSSQLPLTVPKGIKSVTATSVLLSNWQGV
jgi:hypothetical protein